MTNELNSYYTDSLSSGLSSLSEISIKHLPIKRTFDIVFSFVMLIALIPVFLLIALVIFFSSKGLPVYSHERISRGGKTFRCYKFRTMHVDADERLHELLKSNPELQKQWDHSRKLKNDPRITKVGNFLRRTSLDELPQFWNVLKGDLSVVGPRPVVRDEVVKYYGAKAHKILSVRPGLTGIWQTSGRSDTTYSKRILMDEHYVDNHSFLLDLKLVLKTIPSIFFSKGAY
jgi:exopolysaccharide production protein ExoY